jgi:hypothetical protein
MSGHFFFHQVDVVRTKVVFPLSADWLLRESAFQLR